MAGIYLHIPFCKSKCAYCDFYSITNQKFKEDFVKAICEEIKIRKDYLTTEQVQTIYFGGGTPSLLSSEQLEKIIDQIYKYFNVSKSNEITLEANPDDLTTSYLKNIKILGINRLSIGIQSFRDKDLKLMRRRHSVDQSVNIVKQAQKQNFKNISIDLIYGLPNLTLNDWEENIKKAMALDIQHISAYHLTIEPKTLFHKFYINKKITLPSEEESLEQFKKLKLLTEEQGFLHYELSNFARDGFISLHNTNYWMNVKYLGLGPSAHSYNLTSREWNIQNLHAYMEGILKGKMENEREILTEEQKFNEYLITSLRTMWGLNTEIIKKYYGKVYEKRFIEKSKIFLDQNFLTKFNDNYKLTEKGMFISDNIISSLMSTK